MGQNAIGTQSPGSGRSGRRVRGLDADQRRAQRRRELLSAARKLFGERAYADVSIEELCRHAYVGTKGFYELFDNKESCYLALFDEITDALKAEMEQAFRDTGGDPGRLVEAFGRALVRDLQSAAVLFARSGGVSVGVERRRRANRRWTASFVAAAWQRVVAVEEEVARNGLTGVALGVVGGLFELVTDWLHSREWPEGDPVGDLTERLAGFHDVVLEGLVARHGRRGRDSRSGEPNTLGS